MYACVTHTNRLRENSVDPGKLASEKLVDLDVNVIKNTIGHANAYRYSKS